MQQRKKLTTVGLAFAGMMVALVMVSNYISIPTAFSRLHVANAICMLAGMLFGGLRGGVIAGLGSALFDLTFPAYAAEAWVTFLTKGIMALACGAMVNCRRLRLRQPLRLALGSAIGAVSYIALYMLKSYIQMRYVAAMPPDTVAAALAGKLASSAINGVFAIIVAPILYSALMPALRRAGLARHLPVDEIKG
ncbi:MAG: ECF transporter S component [Christensenellales bacterium]